MKWLKDNLGILILSAAILIHAFVSMQAVNAYNDQRVTVTNSTLNPVNVRVIGK